MVFIKQETKTTMKCMELDINQKVVKKKRGRFTENTKQNNRQLLTSVIINEEYIAFLKFCFISHIIIRKMKSTA